MEIGKVGVVGAGQMGHGIAQVFAVAGYDVVLRDINEEFVSKGLSRIRKNLDRLVEKGKMSGSDRDSAMGRISTTVALEALADCSIVVEAATENPVLKKKIFEDLDRVVQAGAVLATNTSSISITTIAAATKRPGKVIGMHFMNPVPVMKLVEIIRGLQTEEATYALTEELTRKIGKMPVRGERFSGLRRPTASCCR